MAAIFFAVVMAIPIFLILRRPKQPADKATRVAIMSMKSDLQGLIMAEEVTRRIRGHYVTGQEEAGHLSSPGVTPPLIVLSDTGWSATVQSKTIPGIRCGVGIFNRNPIKRFAKSGEIVCE